jgi:hypothetical protein
VDLRSLCPWCGKQCHPTRTAALASARRQRHSARRAVRLRAYRCPAGQGWHLTSGHPRRRARRGPVTLRSGTRLR